MIELFSRFMTEQLYSINNRLDKKNIDDFNSNFFMFSSNFINGFEKLEQELLVSLNQLKDNNSIDNENFLNNKTKIIELSGLTKQAKNRLLELSKNYIINNNELSSEYKQVELEYKTKFNQEAKTQNIPKHLVESYVNKKMAEYRDEIKNETKKRFKELLNNPVVDIQQMSHLMNSEKDFTNPIIQIFSKILDKVRLKYNKLIQPILLNLQNESNKFLKDKKLKSSDEIYKKLVQESSDGYIFLRTGYKIEYYNKINELQNKINTAEEQYGIFSKEREDAFNEYRHFVNLNTIQANNQIISPTDEWIDDLSDLSNDEKKYLEYIKNLAIELNGMYNIKFKSLKKTIAGADFYRIPSQYKESLTGIKAGNLTSGIKEYWEQLTKTQSDQTDMGDLAQLDINKGVYKVYSDMAGKEVNYIPIHFRGKIPKGRQSIDLATLYAMEAINAGKFKEKNEVINDLIMFKSVIAENGVYKVKGFNNKFIANKQGDPNIYGEEDSFLIKKLESMLNNRMYEKTSEYAGTINGKDVNKIESFIRGIISKSSMALNIISAPANLVTGKAQSFLEFLRDTNITRKDVENGEKFFFNNLGGIMSDLGSNVYKSLPHQILLENSGLVSFSMLQNSFEHNKFLSLANSKVLYFAQESGEHYIQAVHTFSILSSAKILDKDGNFLDKDGNIVDSKEKAASLLDLQTLDSSGNLAISLKKDFYTTLDTINSFKEGGNATVKSYISSSLIKSQGQYSKEYQSELERHFYGKALYHFKKHIISPALSRWRGASNIFKREDDIVINYNFDLQRPDEGNYVTTVRFLKNHILPKIKKFQLKMMMTDFNNLDEWEQANIKKTLSELLLVKTFAVLSLLFAGAASDDDDLFWYAATVFRRLESESAQYYNVNEAWRVLKNPLSTLRLIEDTSDVVGSLINIVDPMTEERFKKFSKEASDVVKYIPGNKLFKDSKEAYDYLNSNN